jgi:hypothetical protein
MAIEQLVDQQMAGLGDSALLGLRPTSAMAQVIGSGPLAKFRTLDATDPSRIAAHIGQRHGDQAS